jgi:hypothetical protein
MQMGFFFINAQQASSFKQQPLWKRKLHGRGDYMERTVVADD